MAGLCTKLSEIKDGSIPEKTPDQGKKPVNYYQSVVDLDKPSYALSVLENPSYIPVKHIKVNMPRFIDTKTEHWLYSVRRYFIFNKVSEDQKLLMVN